MKTGLVEELVKDLNIGELGAHIGKLIGRHIKEILRAKHISEDLPCEGDRATIGQFAPTPDVPRCQVN